MLSRRDIEKELGKGINIFPVIRENFKENVSRLSLCRRRNADVQPAGVTLYADAFRHLDGFSVEVHHAAMAPLEGAYCGYPRREW